MSILLATVISEESGSRGDVHMLMARTVFGGGAAASAVLAAAILTRLALIGRYDIAALAGGVGAVIGVVLALFASGVTMLRLTTAATSTRAQDRSPGGAMYLVLGMAGFGFGLLCIVVWLAPIVSAYTLPAVTSVAISYLGMWQRVTRFEAQRGCTVYAPASSAGSWVLVFEEPPSRSG